MESEGDIRVLLVIDLVLSFFFSYMVVWVMDLASINEFAWETVFLSTVVLAGITYVVVLR